MTTATEQRLIRRYFLMPRLAFASLLALFPAGGALVLCFMVDDAFLNAEGMYELGVFGTIAIMLISSAITIACAVGIRTGMNKPAWLELVARANAQQARTSSGARSAMAGGVALGAAGRLSEGLNDGDSPLSDAAQVVGGVLATAGFVHMMIGLSDHAREVGQALGVTLPNPKRYMAAAALIPSLAVVALWVPRMASTVSTNRSSQERAAATVQALCGTLEPACGEVSAPDPRERFEDDGYLVIGRLRTYEAPFNSSVMITVSNDGHVVEVRYEYDVDFSLTPEENIGRAEKEMATLHCALVRADVEFADEGLLAKPFIPEEFSEQFTESHDEEFFVDVDDTGTLEVWLSYSPNLIESSPEDSFPRIYLVLDAK